MLKEGGKVVGFAHTHLGDFYEKSPKPPKNFLSRGLGNPNGEYANRDNPRLCGARETIFPANNPTHKKNFPKLPSVFGTGALGSFLRGGGFGRGRTSFPKEVLPLPRSSPSPKNLP